MSDRLRWVLGFVALVLIVAGASWWAMAGAPHAAKARSATTAVVATAAGPDSVAKPVAAPPPATAAPVVTAAGAKIDWSRTQLIDLSQSPDIPKPLRQGIIDLRSVRHHLHRKPKRDCSKIPRPINAPDPLRMTFANEIEREDGRLVLRGETLESSNFDVKDLADCIIANAPVGLSVDAPGVKAGAPFHTISRIALYGHPPGPNEPAPKPQGPLVSMMMGIGKSVADCRTKVRTGAAAGKPCKSPTDCAEVCCSCNGGKVWFASADCSDGVCQGAARTCKDALVPNPTLCTGPVTP